MPPMQQQIAVKSPARTPTQSPTKKTMMITEGQKQALMDNLQLEGTSLERPLWHAIRSDRGIVTERARKLRAQYALQAQSLRTRIELRINRIPHSLRKANIGELYHKYQESMKQVAPEVVSTEAEPEKPSKQHTQHVKVVVPKTQVTENAPSPRPRGLKRTRWAYFTRTFWRSQLIPC